MSKSIYDEALDIIKQRVNTIRLNTKIGSRTIADKENAVLLYHIEYNLNRLCELVEKQEKLLKLYKELSRIRLYLFGEIDAITGERLMEKDIEINNKIKELENV